MNRLLLAPIFYLLVFPAYAIIPPEGLEKKELPLAERLISGPEAMELLLEVTASERQAQKEACARGRAADAACPMFSYCQHLGKRADGGMSATQVRIFGYFSEQGFHLTVTIGEKTERYVDSDRDGFVDMFTYDDPQQFFYTNALIFFVGCLRLQQAPSEPGVPPT